jgi:hypothetical protein
VSDFFNAVKGDLLDRRLLPIVVVVGAGLLAALAYAVLSGGGSGGATAQPPVSAPLAPGSAVIAVTPVQPSAGRAVAETTSGASQQRQGASRNPFAPIPGAGAASAGTSTSTSTTVSKISASAGGVSRSSASTSASTASSAGTSAGSAGTSSGSAVKNSGSAVTVTGSKHGATSHTSPTPKPAQPVKPRTVYSLTAAFGAAPPGPLQPGVKLPLYANLRRQQALPSAKQPLVVFRGVGAGGKSATFTLVGEALLRGPAACVPSPSQCLAVSLKPGQTEELEFLAPDGTAVSYRLQVLSITPVKATAAAARRLRGVSKAGGLLLSRGGLEPLPGLRYSPQQGVLVPVGDPVPAVDGQPAQALAPPNP